MSEMCTDEHSPVPKVSAPPITANAVALRLLTKGFRGRQSIPAASRLPAIPSDASEECVQHLRSLGTQLHHRGRQSIPAASSLPAIPSDASEECVQHLRSLGTQLHQLLFKHQPNEPRLHHTITNMEELSDPAAQPFLWISSWVDYSEKYGFGYQLCDDGVGVVFNDQTRLIMLPNKLDVHYIERTGEKHYYTMNTTPAKIGRKMMLLSNFRRYMSDNLIKAGEAHARQECDRLTRVPYMLAWKRSSSGVTMHLTNGTVQVDFMNHTKIIVCPVMSAVTYIDDEKNFRTFRLSTLEKYIVQPQFARLAESLKYLYKQIPELLNS